MLVVEILQLYVQLQLQKRNNRNVYAKLESFRMK